MKGRFSGRRVLVTGSSRGIGLEIATAFAAAGASVVLNARTSEGLCAARLRIADASAAAGFAVDVREAIFDVTDPAAIADAVGEVHRRIGPIDILINNAGVQHREPLLTLDLESWRRVIDTNLTGPFLVSQAVVPGMLSAGSGAIVNICSVQTAMSRPTTAPYAASKAGLAGLTRAMCAEWAPGGIRVNGLAPGYVDTDLNAALVADPAFSEWVTARTPARRWGHLGEIAGPALWLCSDEASFVNGQVLYADGGMTSVI